MKNPLGDGYNEAFFIIDLDYTLVNVDTTNEFIKMVCPRRYHIFSKVLRLVVPLNKLFKRIDIHKNIVVYLCLTGKPKVLLKKYSRKLYSLLKRTHLNNSLIDELKEFKKKGYMLILLTASLDIIAKNFKDLGFDVVIGSRTYYRDNKFHRLWDLYHKKHKIVEILKRYCKEIVVIEDDPEPEYYSIPGVQVVKISFVDRNKNVKDQN